MHCYKSFNQLEPSRQEMEAAAKAGRLLSLEIEFSRLCNYNCAYCYLEDDHKYDQELSKEEFKEVILQAGELGAKAIIVLGGEPMLYPHIMEMLKFIRSQSMEVKLFTNGSYIDRETARELYRLGVIVVLKMNSFDEKVQDALTGKKGSYRRIQRAFKFLREAGYSGNDGRPLVVSTVICRQNIDEAVGMWEWLREQKIIPYFEIITPQGKGGENDTLVVDSLEIKKLFHKISEIDAQKYGRHWEPQPPLVGDECLRHLYSCLVNSYGDVEPCVGVNIPVGNVKRDKLGDIIRDSEIIGELRNYREHLKGPCRQCEGAENCYGCRGAAYQLTGDYLGSDPLCWKNADKLHEIAYLPMEVKKLVPHKPPMLLVDKLLKVKEQEAATELKIHPDSIYVNEKGVLEEVAYLEIIAQSTAALKGFKNLKDNRPLKGVLLGIKGLKIFGSARAGDRLVTSIKKVYENSQLGVIKGEVFKGEEKIAEGEIRVLHK